MLKNLFSRLEKLEARVGHMPFCEGGTGAIIEPCRCGWYQHGNHSHPPEDLPKLFDVYGFLLKYDVELDLMRQDDPAEPDSDAAPISYPPRKRDGLLLECSECAGKKFMV